MKTEARLNTVNPWIRLPRLTDKVPLEGMLADVSKSPFTNHTTTATVILEILGYAEKNLESINPMAMKSSRNPRGTGGC